MVMGGQRDKLCDISDGRLGVLMSGFKYVRRLNMLGLSTGATQLLSHSLLLESSCSIHSLLSHHSVVLAIQVGSCCDCCWLCGAWVAVFVSDCSSFAVSVAARVCLCQQSR